MDCKYRIKANVGIDQVLNVNLKQDVDLYEVLSLTLKQENFYKLYSAGYGVIVGRVLANDAFGVPNAKVTVFLPLLGVDELRQDIRSIYPYKSVTDIDNRNVKFNTLPNYKKFDCHQEVGSFPKKQLVLDDDSVLEVYDKYYKYTTVTNDAGDYMIFGVPTGEQILHVNVDLSDIGILSQEPRDFIYKGYSSDLFESPTQFKKSTNLDNLPQIQMQTASVTVYPLWGDKDAGEIAITRKDINLQYKFEPTCVFIGSVMTDNSPNSVSHNCIPDKHVGDASQLSPSKGSIEMIRRTVDDRIEEYPIKGNQLIDGDGTWCYQIPMNLDYVGMDEYGNIVATDNPSKGIPTRARVRFRISLDESGEDSLTRHKARYLVPNNPDIYEGSITPTVSADVLDNDLYYEFGTLTPEECMRDLYWNKVYSIKSYIPRIQMSAHEKTENYLAIKGVNKKDARKNNPIPFNKLNLNFSVPAYYILKSIGAGDSGISGFWRYLLSYSIPYSIDAVRDEILDEMDAVGLDFYNDWLNGCLYFPSWFWKKRQRRKYEKGESVYDSQFCECLKEVNKENPLLLYVYNNCSLVYEDEINGVPNDSLIIRTRNNDQSTEEIYQRFNNMYTFVNFGSKTFNSGIIKKKRNIDGLDVFYYSFGNKRSEYAVDGTYDYVRLFSTDIILLGSLKDCDIDGVPKVVHSLPSTTANIPPIGRYKPDKSDGGDEVKENTPDYEGYKEEGIRSYNGMNWGQYWSEKRQVPTDVDYKYRYGTGLFFGLTRHKVFSRSDWATALIMGFHGLLEYIETWIPGGAEAVKRGDIIPYTDIKSCVNAERISELGVTLDSDYEIPHITSYNNGATGADGVNETTTGYTHFSYEEMDGLITKKEIEDSDTRAWFATLNFNKLLGTKENRTTGYKTYDLSYLYPTNFDGRLGDKLTRYNYERNEWEIISSIAEEYTRDDTTPRGVTTDSRNIDYLDFRFGSTEGRVVETRSGNIESTNNNASASSTTTTTYTVEDGGVIFDRTYPRRIRHFYGYKNGVDTAFPLNRNIDLFVDYQNTFPLYNNSFYFYFGLNQGSTAIDKFYEKFYSKCYNDNVKPFLLNITGLSAATECNRNSGRISINVGEIEFPYTAELILNGNVVRTEHLYMSNYIFTVLQNGRYTVKVTDIYGSELTEEVVLQYQKISLESEIIKAISTEYRNQPKCTICDNDYNGEIQFRSVTLYGTEYQITGLTIQDSGSEYTRRYVCGLAQSLGQGREVIIELTPKNGSKFEDCVCSGCGKGEINGNIINIARTVTFSVTVYETCNNTKSGNIAYYTIKMPDTKLLELYINTVPLKYIVGNNEDVLADYNQNFHNGITISGINDIQLNGWFGLHNPDAYSEIFRNPFRNDEYREQWFNDENVFTSEEIIKKKLEYMFELSSAAYVTNERDRKNYFVAELNGGEGEPLLRSAYPQYDKFNRFNIEKSGEFKSYLTTEHDEVFANIANANIVSENYRYVNRIEDKFPLDGADVPAGETPIIALPYDFNPKYSGRTNAAGNYFAGFSRRANIVNLTETTCEQRDPENYMTVPYGAHDLYKGGVGMCLYDEKDGILQQVYEGTGQPRWDNPNRFFRTEFIDRRFDYNAFYITGHKGIHYDINGDEKSIITTDTYWDKGRMSALTYNGIEMLYDDDYVIVSTGSTEYTYGDDCSLTLDMTSPKQFYESKLYYGDGKYVELINAYYYNENTSARAFYIYNDGREINCEINTNPLDGDAFHNFGFIGTGTTNDNTTPGKVQGYPSERWLDYMRIPYGDYYEFLNVSCSYDNLKVELNQRKITAKTKPGERVSYKIEACELINLVCNDFETDYQKGYFNIKYYSNTQGSQTITLGAIEVTNLPFRISCSGSTGFKTRIENLGIRVCYDVAGHGNIAGIKSAGSFSGCVDLVTGSTVEEIEIPDGPDGLVSVFDTEDNFKNYIFNNGNSFDWDPSHEFINMFFDRLYYSQAADSLMKRIRTFNMSTIYNVSRFNFTYERHDTKTNSFVIPAGEINIDSSGTIEIPDQSSDNTEIEVDTEGSNQDPVTGDNEKHDYTEFSFTSNFIANCLADICFKISFRGTTAFYKLGDNNVGVVEHDANRIKFCIIWRQHDEDILLEKYPDDEAEITVYMKIKNEIKSAHGEGYMSFAFDFIIKGTEAKIVRCNRDISNSGMNTPTDNTNNDSDNTD